MTIKPIRAEDVPTLKGATCYPTEYASLVAGRTKRTLGDIFGLENFGVNLTDLEPGSVSALYHHHELQDEFVFVVVPMLNPDGVVNGNYRCSLAGCDMNRTWDAPQRHVVPPIFHLKRLIKDIKQATFNSR